ncbi:TPM domain-containing protein [bacterium]|nr:TPM domain-containing protein [bacterium]MBU0899910.1 TPM domain-containing protein [bacterium]MBU1153196.1 TPM domain-containing protein [bacterium]MBU1781841.1 TPM domain-containing protein [bacterium]MBU2599937.1 TPM domain-containing protein [bacterium]
MKRYLKKLILCLLLVSLGYISTLYGKEEQKYPTPKGYVNDLAAIIDANYKSYLERLAWKIEKETKVQVAIATISSLEGESIEGYSVTLFEAWKIGRKGKDDGLLILVVPKERKVRIEVGYELEGILPDGLCGQITDKIMIPYFKEGDYGKGLLAGMIYITKIIEKEYQVKIDLDSHEMDSFQVKKPTKISGRSILGSLFTLLLLILCLGSRRGLLGFLLLGLLGSRGGYWRGGGYNGGSGGFSDGFGGFGGGSSGGGGASGSW